MSLPYENATSGAAALDDIHKFQHEARAMDQAKISVCSVLRDWIKGQITAIEVGILSFEGAFLGQILLNDGRTVFDHASTNGLLELDCKSSK